MERFNMMWLWAVLVPADFTGRVISKPRTSKRGPLRRSRSHAHQLTVRTVKQVPYRVEDAPDISHRLSPMIKYSSGSGDRSRTPWRASRRVRPSCPDRTQTAAFIESGTFLWFWVPPATIVSCSVQPAVTVPGLLLMIFNRRRVENSTAEECS